MTPALRRDDFPILHLLQDGRRLVYLDSAATAQKPQVVLDALVAYYTQDNANVYRGVYQLSARATEAYEAARAKVAALIGAAAEQVVFTRGTTESLNLVAYWARETLKSGDEIVVSEMEHHSNLVPWQWVCEKTGARLVFVKLSPSGEITQEALAAAIGRQTALVAMAHVSNVLGTVNPVELAGQLAHEVGAKMIVDGAQSVPHMPVDVGTLGADALAFSGHKMCGPTGIGVLWATRSFLEEMKPFHYGGEMIDHVDLTSSTFKDPPQKFEAGTPNIAGAVALGVAAEYLQDVGLEAVAAHEGALGTELAARLREIEGVSVYGPAGERTGVVAFNVKGVHPHDVATVLDQEAVCIRAGHHCAQPLMRFLGAASTARASLYLYNDSEDVDRLVSGVLKAKEFFSHVSR